METSHQIGQRLARERKRERRIKQEEHLAFKRGKKYMAIVEKHDLLRFLINESLVPQDATRILSTGHLPDSLIITVGFDSPGEA